MLKQIALLSVMLLSSSLLANEDCAKAFDESHRFIFFAVLEGCYLDGLSNEDVDQIMLKGKDWGYEHFIYGCPICGPAIHAFEAYRSRPKAFSNLKSHCSNFGNGLSDEIKKKLYSNLGEERLIAVNELMSGWISKRLKETNMSESDLANLKANLTKKRKQGMSVLKNMKDWELRYASFKTLNCECAACNAAVGMKMSVEKKNGE